MKFENCIYEYRKVVSIKFFRIQGLFLFILEKNVIFLRFKANVNRNQRYEVSFYFNNKLETNK